MKRREFLRMCGLAVGIPPIFKVRSSQSEIESHDAQDWSPRTCPRRIEAEFDPAKEYGMYACYGVKPEMYEHYLARRILAGAACVTSEPTPDANKGILLSAMQVFIPYEYQKSVSWIYKYPREDDSMIENRMGSVAWIYTPNGNRE